MDGWDHVGGPDCLSEYSVITTAQPASITHTAWFWICIRTHSTFIWRHESATKILSNATVIKSAIYQVTFKICFHKKCLLIVAPWRNRHKKRPKRCKNGIVKAAYFVNKTCSSRWWKRLSSSLWNCMQPFPLLPCPFSLFSFWTPQCDIKESSRFCPSHLDLYLVLPDSPPSCRCAPSSQLLIIWRAVSSDQITVGTHYWQVHYTGNGNRNQCKKNNILSGISGVLVGCDF